MPVSASFPQDADREALRDFEQRHGTARFAPIVVVIAAYNEAEGIGPVLEGIPSTCLGMDLDTLVVVDGSTDGTAEAAIEHGAYTCVAPSNRGQGAALRLGYHIARQGGASYIVTTDADAQYDIAGLPMLLSPLLADEADFVTGSRILGQQETRDAVRRLGVHVFAWLATACTGQRVTDTSFGFRAMKAEVAGSVTLVQPQYQSSELLLGALMQGYRVLEQPMTMRVRAAGKTKKGNNLVYGTNYARVVFRTWLRERSRSQARGGRESGSRHSEETAGVDR